MSKQKKRMKRSIRLIKKGRGTSERPRLSVYRSNRMIYAQIIDDAKHVTLASSSSFDKEKKKGLLNVEISKNVGKEIGKKALSVGVKTIVFDRNGYKYHGNVKALAEGVREEGVKF